MWESGDRSARGAGRRYVEDSSTGGIRRAARPGVISRVIWGCVLVLCAAMAIYSVVRLHTVRSQRPGVMTSGLDEGRSVTFPDVTICKVTSVSEVLMMVTEGGFLDRGNLSLWRTFQTQYLESSQLPKNCQTEQENRALRHRYQTLLDGLTSDQRLMTGHPLTDLMTDCTLGDSPCNATHFRTFYHHQYGNCFTFSTDPSLQSVSTTGPQPGLTLDLNTCTSQNPELGPDSGQEAGFIVGIHDSRDTVATLQQTVWRVPEGNAAYLALSKSTTINPSECIDDSEDTTNNTNTNNLYAADSAIAQQYSLLGCQHGCLQKELFERCGCCDLDLPCPATFLSPPADPGEVAGPRCGDEEELQCREEVLQAYTDGSLSCLSQCLLPCREISYSVRLSLTSVSSSQLIPPVKDIPSFTRLTVENNAIRNTAKQQEIPQDVPDQQEVPDQQDRANISPPTPLTPPQDPEIQTPPIDIQPSRRRREVTDMYGGSPTQTVNVRVHVYFEDLRTRTTETVSANDWSEWLAAVGGLFSLWLGLSILGVVEVLHLLLELFALVCYKCCQPRPASVKPFAEE